MNKQMVLVIGGPGSSGSSTISKRLAEHFNIERVYGGSYFRDEAQSKGYASLESFYSQVSENMVKEIDAKVDDHFRELAKRGNVLIESKIFAALATKENIPCSAKIWITASLDVRVKRALGKEKILNPLNKLFRRAQITKDLQDRWAYDSKRYKELYDLDYSEQERYNDLVIDSSNQTVKETFNTVINFLKEKGLE
jgi:cytidylate kinase